MTITPTGFWTLATLAAFSIEILARGMAIRLRHGQFAVMTDAGSLPVQSADVARGLEGLLAQSMKITTAPFAIVASSPLAKLQLERVLRADHTRLFLVKEEAEAWLEEAWAAETAA